MDVDALEAIEEEIACLGVRRGGGHMSRVGLNGSGPRVGIGGAIGGMNGQRAISFGGNDVAPRGNAGIQGSNAVAGPSRSVGSTSANGNTPRRTTTTITNKDTPTSYQTHLNYRPLIQKKTGKKWDRTAYASTGRKEDGGGSAKKAGAKKPVKKKKKRNVLFDAYDSGAEEDDDKEDDDEDAIKELAAFDQFPMPFIDPSE